LCPILSGTEEEKVIRKKSWARKFGRGGSSGDLLRARRVSTEGVIEEQKGEHLTFGKSASGDDLLEIREGLLGVDLRVRGLALIDKRGFKV